MSGYLEIKESKTIWRIDNFFSILKQKSSTVTSEKISMCGNYWHMSLEISKTFSGLFQIKIHSPSHTPEKVQYIIRIDSIDGSCFFNRVADFTLNTPAYVMLNKKEFLDAEDILSKDGNLTVICIGQSPSKNGNPPNKPLKDVSSQTVSLECSSRNVDLPKEVSSQTVNVECSSGNVNPQKEVSSQTVNLESIERLSDNFRELFTNGRHADIKIRVGNREFQAHKAVLATRSPVLDSMFSNDMLENNSGILNITDCDEDTFEDFLTFLYCGKLDRINCKKFAPLYEIADKYDLQELKKECVKCLITEMSVDTVCDALRVATLHEEEELLEKAKNFFTDNAKSILETTEWEIFLGDHLRIANELFKKILTIGNRIP